MEREKAGESECILCPAKGAPRHGWPAHTLLPFLLQNPAVSHITFPHFAALVQVCDGVGLFFFFFYKSSMNMEEC